MDSAPVEYIRHRLRRLKDSVTETREHFLDLSPFGPYPASAPYYEKSGIQTLLDSLKDGAGEKEALCTEFREVLQYLELAEQDLGVAYRTALREELRVYATIYHAAVCHENLSLVRSETDHDLFCRDRITVLVRELEREYDLAELRHFIGTIDLNHCPAAGPSQEPEENGRRLVSGSIVSCRPGDKISS